MGRVVRHTRRRGVAQSGSAPALGAGCRGFESLLPDHCFAPNMPRALASAFEKLPSAERFSGGCSSPGRAPDCGSGGSGFEKNKKHARKTTLTKKKKKSKI